MLSKTRRDTPHDVAATRIQTALRKQLPELDLRELGLTSLPEPLVFLDYPDPFENPLANLSGQFASLPESLLHLTNLQSLDLSGNQLTSLPESLGRLTNLQSLDLSGNRLTDLPESLVHLTNLQSLDLSGNQLTDLPESLGRLTNLQNLGLFGNILVSLPQSLLHLSDLQNLDLSFNQLIDLPECIDKLTNLKTFDLAGNQLTSLPESIGKLSRLQVLELSGNQLTGLPSGIRKLRVLTHLLLHENPALGLPLEVLGPTSIEIWGSEKKESGDPGAILDYYFRIHPPEREGKRAGQVLRELKVILVGRGEVGKTSLVEVLKGGKFVEGMVKTEGIAITRWPMMLPEGEATALVWDFGGQEIMH